MIRLADEVHDCLNKESLENKEEDCHRIVGKEDGEAPKKCDKETELDFGHDDEYLLECYLLCGVDSGDSVNDHGRG